MHRRGEQLSGSGTTPVFAAPSLSGGRYATCTWRRGPPALPALSIRFAVLPHPSLRSW